MIVIIMLPIIKKNELNDGRILSLEFSNPKKKNALSLSMLDELIIILSDWDTHIMKIYTLAFHKKEAMIFHLNSLITIDLLKIVKNINIKKQKCKTLMINIKNLSEI